MRLKTIVPVAVYAAMDIACSAMREEIRFSNSESLKRALILLLDAMLLIEEEERK
jgi:hypothetical protein